MRYFIIVIALILLAAPAQAGIEGTSQLITASQLKSSNANDEALNGASRQRSLVAEQKGLRAAQTGATGSTATPQTVKPSKAKLHNPNIAKIKQLDVQMKAMKQKLESISGLPADQQQRIDQMHDHLMKMMALMGSLLDKISESQNAP